MRLIATLGSTKANHLHKYYIENKIYEEYFSFLALKKHYNIDDSEVVIIGTEATKRIQSELIKNYQFIEIDENNFEDIFAKNIKVIEKDCIIDLTQSFRSVGFGSLLGYIMSNLSDRKAKDILYAQVQNNCNAAKESCEFKFQSIKRYEEITELVREINLFVTSWYVLTQKKEEFMIIHNNLVEISKRLLLNDLDILEYVFNIEKEIERIDKEYLKFHLSLLDKEMKKLKNALMKNEYQKLFSFSKLYFEKNLLLQSLTILFEAIGAYTEAKTNDNFICKKGDKEYKKSGNKYYFRNCLKSLLSKINRSGYIAPFIKKNIKIASLKDFAKHYMNVYKLINNSAHAFINGRELMDFKNSLKEEINYFKRWIDEDN